MFTKNTTRDELNNWLMSTGKYRKAIEFIVMQLCCGENKVAGKITVYNNLYNLYENGKASQILVEAYELGFN